MLILVLRVFFFFQIFVLDKWIRQIELFLFSISSLSYYTLDILIMSTVKFLILLKKDSSFFSWILFTDSMKSESHFLVTSQPSIFRVSSFLDVLWSWVSRLAICNQKMNFLLIAELLIAFCPFLAFLHTMSVVCSMLPHAFFDLSLTTVCWEGSYFYCHFLNKKRDLEVFSVLFKATQTVRRNSLIMLLKFLFWRI